MAESYVIYSLLIVTMLELLVLQILHQRDKAKWEVMWVLFIEVAAYGSNTISPDAEHVTFKLENGMYLEWMRYAGWLLTCPVLLMTLVSMTTEEGTKPPTVRLVPLLVANLTMILFGITAGLTTSGAKWFIFGGALCFGGFVFSSAIQCLVALVSSSPTAAVRTSSIWLAVTFLCGWGIFPLTFLTGHSGLNVVSKEMTVNLFVLGDVLSKNMWVAIATLRQHQLEKHLFSTDEPGEDTGSEVKPKAVRFADGRRRTDRRASCSTMILDELQVPRAPNAALGDLEHDAQDEDGLDPGPISSNSHSPRRYTGAAPNIRVSRVAQRRGSCSTMILNELNPQQEMPRAQSSPRSPSPLPSPPPPQQEAQTQKTQQQQQEEEGKQEDLAVMAQVLAKYHSLPSAERDKLSPVFAGLLQEKAIPTAAETPRVWPSEL
eukprot:CAMPEP_0118813342 /NCGR_PEP_ID=MMETSP1162-20130426/2871_1 /TAXON_ID=33656 /ORGANISM="Phaeocystis Sp, Strain CCMP2710" /LENGTH=431 /DNA_ID=CAMNT_0006743121 /DNA_START=56 /DNA_END=1351 /DNA_ORIENTATION=-